MVIGYHHDGVTLRIRAAHPAQKVSGFGTVVLKKTGNSGGKFRLLGPFGRSGENSGNFLFRKYWRYFIFRGEIAQKNSLSKKLRDKERSTFMPVSDFHFYFFLPFSRLVIFFRLIFQRFATLLGRARGGCYR